MTIAGAAAHEGNNQTIIIREIDGDYLRFYENSFTINEGGDAETLTISRDVPDMDFICENENRLWGCKEDTIYSSKLGDPFNWNVFDGLSTDSYAVNVGSAGDFTACCSYLGYPVFFKEEINLQGLRGQALQLPGDEFGLLGGRVGQPFIPRHRRRGIVLPQPGRCGGLFRAASPKAWPPHSGWNAIGTPWEEATG